MSNRKVITVDGLAGSGKTSISTLLAKRLGYAHLNSGILYRCAAYAALCDGADLTQPGQVERVLDTHFIAVERLKDGGVFISLDGRDVSGLIRAPEVSEATSIISGYRQVRSRLLPVQRGALPELDLVAEGRDMGTVVFPDADLKFFITADENIRVERRLKELLLSRDKKDQRELNSLKRKMKIEIMERDRRDSSREHSPPVPADDAIIVDNTTQILTEVVENMYHSAASRGLAA